MSDPPLCKTGTQRGLSQRGRYTLVISLGKRKKIRVGKLGEAWFPEGIYLYTGSAMNGLRARVSRHIRKTKTKLRWHIDHLLQSPEAQIKKILMYAPAWRECQLNQSIMALPGARIILKGFGASDCASRCLSHLIYLESKMPPKRIGRHFAKRIVQG